VEEGVEGELLSADEEDEEDEEGDASLEPPSFAADAESAALAPSPPEDFLA